MLARIYAELDLVAAECIRAGVLDGLSAPQLAAVLARWSTRPAAPMTGPPTADARCASNAAMSEVRRIWREVSLVERDARLAAGPEPDIGFSEVAYGWAAGRSLADGAGGHRADGRRLRSLGPPGGRLRRPDRRRRRSGRATRHGRRLVRTMRRGVVTYSPEDDSTATTSTGDRFR